MNTMQPDHEWRYSDGPTVEVDLVFAAPPSALWALVSDINLPARFSAELMGAEWLDGATGPELGASFVGRNTHSAAGAWQTTSTIVEFEIDRVFGWVVGDVGDPAAHWRFTLTPEGSGTRITQWMRMGPGRSGLNPAIDAMPDKESKIIRRRLAEHRVNMLANLEGIRDILEG